MAATKASLEAAARINNTETDMQETKRLSLAERYKAEPKVVVMGAPMYQAYFGNQMPIILNGIPIYVPLNGERFEIPTSYAEIFNARIRSVNEEIAQQKQRSDYKSNFEAFPGELDLVRAL